MICNDSPFAAELRSMKRRKPSASASNPTSASDHTVKFESRIQL